MTLFSPTSAGRSVLSCPAVVAGLDLVCTCSTPPWDVPTATDAVWKIDGAQTTTGLSGTRKSTWTKASSTRADNGKKVKCTRPSSTESAEISTVVEVPQTPILTGIPASVDNGVSLDLTCNKAPGDNPTSYIFLKDGQQIGTATGGKNIFKYTAETADDKKMFSCKAVDGSGESGPSPPMTLTVTALLAPTLTSNAVTAVPVSSVVVFICVKNVNIQRHPTSYKFFDENGEIRNGVTNNMLTFKVTKADDGRRIRCQYFNTATAKINSNIITLKVNMSTIGTTKPTVGTTKPTEPKTTDDHKIVVAGFVGPLIVLIIGMTVAIILWIRVKRAMKDIKDGNGSRQPQPNVNGTPAGNSDTGQEYINVAFEDETNITRPNDPHDYENIEGSWQRAGNLGPRATNESVTSDQVYAELDPVSQSEYLDIRQVPV